MEQEQQQELQQSSGQGEEADCRLHSADNTCDELNARGKGACDEVDRAAHDWQERETMQSANDSGNAEVQGGSAAAGSGSRTKCEGKAATLRKAAAEYAQGSYE